MIHFLFLDFELDELLQLMAGALMRILEIEAEICLALLIHENGRAALVVGLGVHVGRVVLRYLPFQKHLFLQPIELPWTCLDVQEQEIIGWAIMNTLLFLI